MKKIIAGALAFSPLFAFAQALGEVDILVVSLQSILTTLIPVTFAVALLFFFWGVAKYILAAGDEEAKGQGQRIMIGGIIGIFVIAAIFGIVEFIGSNLGIATTGDFNTSGVK